MSADRFHRVMSIFERAVRLPARERAAFLIAECAGDDLLLREVEGMIAHDAAAGTAFESKGVAVSGGAELLAREMSRRPAALGGDDVPSEIGSYRILRRIGQGGMGTVFEAEQQTPRRTVALKVVRPELVSQSLAQRFEFEAHVLGRLQHPGIAQIFEAGTAQTVNGPQMFLAMELIRGKSLIEYANAEPNPLNSRQRLALLARVCDAVQHAHQRGVIHRDLKPSNILVAPESPDVGSSYSVSGSRGQTRMNDTGASLSDSAVAGLGQPKILDFGVARAIDFDPGMTTAQTGFGQLIGTVAYMSPEQLAGDPKEIDTRTDVYALGVLLYQLLAGKLPHDVASHGVVEALRIVREETPTQLSRVSREYRGEIETIVFKALEKEKSRRYQSAAEFGADIRRYLTGEPIQAKRDSHWYVLQKTLRRYRLATAFAAVILVLAVGASAALAVLYERAERSKDVALVEGEAAKRAQAEAQRAAASAEEERAIARAAQSEAQRESERARMEARKAKQVNKVLLQIFKSADPRAGKGTNPTVREVLDRFSETELDRLSAFPDVRAAIENTLGQSYYMLGDVDRSLGYQRAAYDRARQAEDPETRTAAADYAVSLAATLGELGKLAEAEELLRSALEVHRAATGEGSSETAWDMSALGAILTYQRKFAEAEPMIRRAIELFRAGVTTDDAPLDTEQSPLAEAIATLVFLLDQKGQFAEAEPLAREVLEITRTQLGTSHPSYAMALNNLGAIRGAVGDLESAARYYEEAIAVVRRVSGEKHFDVARGLVNLATVVDELGQFEKSDAYYREAIEIFTTEFPREHPQVAAAISGWGRCLVRVGRAAEAEPLLREAIAAREKLYPPGDARTAISRRNLGACLTALKRYDEAEPLLKSAFTDILAERGSNNDSFREVVTNLIELYTAQGRTEEAEALRWKLKNDPATTQPR